MWPFGGDKERNPITEVDKDPGKLVCEGCGTEPLHIYEVGEGDLLCKECAEAEVRRLRFESEEEEWKPNTPGESK